MLVYVGGLWRLHAAMVPLQKRQSLTPRGGNENLSANAGAFFLLFVHIQARIGSFHCFAER
ncbi:hypothetical protein, partial [Klebsiella aerogenes]|uniref:hypothetical protein n=1 Tax=Klebsiella aerogenes TaxID=548 RepID=UPI001BCD0DB0